MMLAFLSPLKIKIMNTNNNNDTYQRITDFVISQLEKEEIVWQKGWNNLGLPKKYCHQQSLQGMEYSLPELCHVIL